MRYYDELLKTSQTWKNDALRDSFRTAQRFILDNVAEYYGHGLDRPDFDIHLDCPNVTPCYQNMWVEFRMPSFVHGERPTGKETIGMLVIADRLEASWDMKFTMWMKFPTDPAHDPYPILQFQGGIGLDGIWDKNPFVVRTYNLMTSFIEDRRKTKENSDGFLARFFSPYVHIYSLAMSFLHCKNTEIIEQKPDAALAKATWRRHGVGLHTFKTLNITPMAKTISDVQTTTGQSWKQALHSCRGHFKDYREHGLFGKTKGLFWWGEQLRGSASEGEVTKTYKIFPPATARAAGLEGASCVTLTTI